MNERQHTTRYIKHLAESANFKGGTFNKHYNGLIGNRFEMPNVSYTHPLATSKTHFMKKLILGILVLLSISCSKKTKEEFSIIGTTVNVENGTQIQRYIELNKEPKIGEKYVDFEMTNQYGITRKLSDLSGKVILLEFWSSRCGPCLQENPNLVKTYNQFNSKGFEIFAVSLDEYKESWLEAIKKDGLIWENVCDFKGAGNEASIIYGISGIPDNFLIDKNGIIVGRDLRGEKLTEKLTELLD